MALSIPYTSVPKFVELARVIRTVDPVQFDMNVWLGPTTDYMKNHGVDRFLHRTECGLVRLRSHDCGTAGCIAGWAVAISLDNPDVAENVKTWGSRTYPIELQAADILGISRIQASRLFRFSKVSIWAYFLEKDTFPEFTKACVDYTCSVVDHILIDGIIPAKAITPELVSKVLLLIAEGEIEL